MNMNARVSSEREMNDLLFLGHNIIWPGQESVWFLFLVQRQYLCACC